MGLLIGIAIFVALGVFAWRFGSDSRDGRDWSSYEGPGSSHSGRADMSVTSGGTVDGTWAG